MVVGNRWFNKYIWGTLMMMAIILIPFTLSLHLFFDDKDSSAINFFGLEILHVYNNNSAFVWFILTYLIPVILFLLWFLSTPFWWRHFIFFPILPFAWYLPSPFYDSFNHCYGLTSFVIITSASVYFDYLSINKIKRQKKTLIIPDIKVSDMKYWKIFLRSKAYLKTLQGGKEVLNRNKKIEKLYYNKTILEQMFSNHKMINEEVFVNKKVLTLIFTMLVLTPIIFYSQLLIPKGCQLLDLGLFSVGNNGFLNVFAFVRYVNVKLCVILPLCVWFISSNNWWRYALFSPIIMYTYQLWEAIQDGVDLVDETVYVRALPTILILLLFLLLASHFVKYQSKILDVHESINTEIEGLLQQLEGSAVETVKKQRWQTMIGRDATNEENKKTRVSDLQRLKKEIEIEIKKLNNK